MGNGETGYRVIKKAAGARILRHIKNTPFSLLKQHNLHKEEANAMWQ